MGLLLGFPTPQDGLSAYQIWLNLGNVGTEADFIEDLKGLSAYQIWIALGNVGTEADFILSLEGEPGVPGLSAYQTWLNNGHSGTETAFLNWLKADSVTTGIMQNWDMGINTPSAYNVTAGNGNFVRIGWLVQVSGTILPDAPNGMLAMIKVKLPYTSKNRITRLQIANTGAFSSNGYGENIYASVSENSNILTILIETYVSPQSLFGFSFSYITDEPLPTTSVIGIGS